MSIRSRPTVKALFSGKREKWLPLFQRLNARFSKIPGLELTPAKTTIKICRSDDSKVTIGHIRVAAAGLLVGLVLESAAPFKSKRLQALKRASKDATHVILVTEASEIDPEFLTWVKAANSKARNAKPRST